MLKSYEKRIACMGCFYSAADFSISSETISGQSISYSPSNEVATATATFTSVAADRTMYIAGLALPKAKGQSGRFKGRCYVCGERGHSKSNCSMTNLERKPEAVAGLCAESIKPPH
eukprot:s724_g24.t1